MNMAKRTEASSRVLTLYAEFKPDGDPRDNIGSLMDLWMEAQTHLERVGRRKLEREEKEWAELQNAIDKLAPLVASVFRGEIDGAEVSEDACKLVPQKELRRKVYDWYTEVINKDPEEKARERAELEAAREDINGRGESLKHNRNILDSLNQLSDAAQEGDSKAAEALYDAAVMATSLLGIVARRHPEQFKAIAAMKGTWPVIASEEPGWEKTALDQIEKLELGKGLSAFKTRLKRVRGSDVNLPARRWARAAVRTIDETRWRLPFFMQLVKELGGTDEWAEFAVSRRWSLAKRPNWVTPSMKLALFSQKSFNEWKSVVRQLIRESVPDFHLLPEWSTQRMTCEANGRTTPGEIQNAILDDIVSALKRLAPDEPC